MQVIADRARVAHFALTPFLRCRRDDTVLVDIQSKIEFFFHSSVFVCSSCLHWNAPRTPLSRPLVRLCFLTGSSPRENMNGKHTASFNAALARSRRARSHRSRPSAPMLDVHPPHERVHSWAQFFVH